MKERRRERDRERRKRTTKKRAREEAKDWTSAKRLERDDTFWFLILVRKERDKRVEER